MTPTTQQLKMLRHMLVLHRTGRAYYAPHNGEAHKDLRALGGLVEWEVDGPNVVARLTVKGAGKVLEQGEK